MQIETITDLNDGRSRRKVIFNDNNSNNWEMNEDLDNEDEDNEGIESDIDDTTDENDEDDDSDENDDGEELAEESSQAKVSTKTSSKTPASATRKNISIDNHSDEENDNEIKWKTNLSQKAANAFIARQNTTRNLSKLVYGKYLKMNNSVTFQGHQNFDTIIHFYLVSGNIRIILVAVSIDFYLYSN